MTTPTLLFICKRDQLCGLMLRGVLVVWLFWLGLLVAGLLDFSTTDAIVAYVTPLVLSAATLISCIGIPMVLWRALMIQRVFRAGETVDAVVTDVQERQGIHRIWYRYEWNGRSYRGRNLIKQEGSFQAVKAGDVMKVSLLSGRPARSYAWELFR